MRFIKKTMRFFILSFILCTIGVSAKAASADDNHPIAIVVSRSAAPYAEAVNAIKANFVNGNAHVQFSEYNLEGESDNAAEIIKQIGQAKAKIVFAIGTEAATEMSKAITNVPIVSAMIYEAPPEPGKNQYGVFLKVPFDARFKICKSLGLSHQNYALPYLKGKEQGFLSEAEKAAIDESVKIIKIPMSSLRKFQWALEESQKSSDYLLMVLDNELYKRATAQELLLFSARNQLPLIAFSHNYVKSGALLSISSNFEANGRQAAKLGKDILSNTPIKRHFQATDVFEVAWNNNVARAFGIELSPQAKEIITHFY